MRLALISLNQVWNNKSENLTRCRDFMAASRARGCDMVIFPEMTLTGFSLDVHILAEYFDQSETMSQFSALAAEFSTDIIFGCCLRQRDGSRPQNVLCHAKPTGGSEVVYAKLHPFSFAGEQRVMRSGDRLGFIELSSSRFGGSICYDLRFPVPFTLMAPICTGVICIANWPEKRIFHWRSLLVARAIENQMFMIGVNRTGVDGNGLNYVKSSLIVAPDGEIITPEFSSEEFDEYDIDESKTRSYRQEFPTLRDGNFALYSQL
jgi:omega-amidase